MAPAYKLTYFGVKALGEGIRLLLSYGNIDFEDVRVTFDDWPNLKPTTPLGQLPILEFDGKRYYQSLPICRYLARKFGLAGDNDLESLEIDIVVATIDELRGKAAVAHYEPDVDIKAKSKAILQKDVFPIYFKKLESYVAENNGYFACGKLTWPDLLFTGMVDYLSEMVGYNIREKHPALAGVCKKVESLPQIKAWYEKAPHSVI